MHFYALIQRRSQPWIPRSHRGRGCPVGLNTNAHEGPGPPSRPRPLRHPAPGADRHQPPLRSGGDQDSFPALCHGVGQGAYNQTEMFASSTSSLTSNLKYNLRIS